MNPAELLHLVTHAAQNAEHLALERQLVNAAGHGVGAVQVLGSGTGGDADGPRSAVLSGQTLSIGHGTHPGMNDLGWGNIDSNFADKIPIGIVDHDAAVASVADVDIALCIGGDGVGGVEFELFGMLAILGLSVIAPLLHPIAVLVELGNTRVDVAIADENVALRIPGHVGGLKEGAGLSRKRRTRMFQWMGIFIGRFRFTAE